MAMSTTTFQSIALLTLALLPASGLTAIDSGVTEVDYSGNIATELRLFTQNALYAEQADEQLSGTIEPEFYVAWNDGLDSLTVKPFVRLDNRDDERQHADLRELMWIHVGKNWELHTGVGKVFWGVTESQHLVDIINQTDWVEAVDGEDKLGQPMGHYSYISDWGVWDAFFLPYFRERTFPSRAGRFRFGLPIDQDNARYESGKEQYHRDYALRWSRMVGDWEVGLSYFNGTDREPRLLRENNHLTPYYVQLKQAAIDLQASLANTLWKFEAVHRTTWPDNYWATTAGLEYTQVGIFSSYKDLGLLMEYLYDDRGQQATMPGQNDLFLGTRLIFNNAAGTEILIGLTQDLDYSDSRGGFLEASSRINKSWKWHAEVWLFQSGTSNDSNYWLRRDDHLQLKLVYYF